jgi:FMN-dependent NADH-azoreductase
MTRLLRIDASSRTTDSISRRYADLFVERWFQTRPNGKLVVRDLAHTPIPHISAMTISAYYTPPKQMNAEMKSATRLSDELIAELRAADLLLISTAMYNFTVPSALKAWVDQIVRIGHTFSYVPEQGFTGLLQGKRAVIVSASGADFSGEAMRSMDFLTPYLKALLGFLGIQSVETIALEGTSIDPSAFERSEAMALDRIAHLAGTAPATASL